LDLALDYRDYYHPTYGLNATATGRYASRGADEGGPQGQNWPHQLLNLVVPDNPGDELTEADLSQAEDMIIAWDSQDKIAIEAFGKNIDSHRLKACWAFRQWEYSAGLPSSTLLAGITEVCSVCATLGQTKCNHAERFIAKQSGYAFKYKMGVRKFVNKILPNAGVYITENEGKRIRDRVVSPPTVRWQSNTEYDLRKSRWLTNLLGRKREFYGLLDDGGELLRAALSWKAQSVVGVIAGRAVSRLERSLRLIGPSARLVTQRHDSVLVSHPPRDRARVRLAISEAFYSPIVAHGRTLNIPLEVKHGPNWRDLEKEAK
jgi:DNA polymerase I-like protein with 3'-5' exonuclease and polymerase domains